MAALSSTHFDIIVIGGGIAGVSCVQTLARECPDKRIILISASPMLKVASNCVLRGQNMQEFDVDIQSFSYLKESCPNIEVRLGQVVKLDAHDHLVILKDGVSLKYGKLCICTGGKPKLINGINDQIRHLVLGIRDTETVKTFQSKLSNARRIVVVGNGGIATELVYQVTDCAIVWAIKHDSIGATFFDSVAAQFFMPHLKEQKEDKKKTKISKRLKYTVFGDGNCKEEVIGSALGPDWSSGLNMIGCANGKDVTVEYNCEVEKIYANMSDIPDDKRENLLVNDQNWPIYIELTNGKLYGCDLIVSATGVLPNNQLFLPGNNFTIAEDEGLLVNQEMLTSESDIYAAGDVCSTGWEAARHWFQMRLWSQARVMGVYAAFCIISHLTQADPLVYFNFDIFTHITEFFGYKVVLLGLFNGQKLDGKYEMLVRVTAGQEYIKVILKDGKMNGAILIGDTDLEETFENLILNQLDLTRYGDDLLNSHIDIEDYFD